MTSKSTIVSEIKARVGTSGYSSWRIGLTHDAAERKKFWRDTEGKDVNCWTQWTADSKSDAEAIESHFINEKMMKGGTGGNLTSGKTIYVYIF